MKIQKQSTVMMLLLIIILYYFNDFIHFELTHIPRTSYKTKMKRSINKTYANGFNQAKGVRDGNILHLNSFNKLKKSAIDKTKFFMNTTITTSG